MRTQAIDCPTCGKNVYKVRAQTGKENIPLGTWCPECKTYRDNEGWELRAIVPLKSQEEIRDILDHRFFERH